MRRSKRPQIQGHHISYYPEIKVRVFRGEHMILTELKRHTKNVSTNFIIELKRWISENEQKAVDI